MMKQRKSHSYTDQSENSTNKEIHPELRESSNIELVV